MVLQCVVQWHHRQIWHIWISQHFTASDHMLVLHVAVSHCCPALYLELWVFHWYFLLGTICFALCWLGCILQEAYLCFLANLCKRWLNQDSLLHCILCCLLFELYLICVFSCTVSFLSIRQVIGCEDCLWNDRPDVSGGIKLYLPFDFKTNAPRSVLDFKWKTPWIIQIPVVFWHSGFSYAVCSSSKLKRYGHVSRTLDKHK